MNRLLDVWESLSFSPTTLNAGLVILMGSGLVLLRNYSFVIFKGVQTPAPGSAHGYTSNNYSLPCSEMSQSDGHRGSLVFFKPHIKSATSRLFQ